MSSLSVHERIHDVKGKLTCKFSFLFVATRFYKILQEKKTNPTYKKSTNMPQSSSASFSRGKSALTPEHELPVLHSHSSSPRRPSGLSKIRWGAYRLTCSSRLLIANHWCFSEIMREPMAEFAGVAVFLIIGTGVDCQVVLSTDPAIASSQRGVSRFSPE